MRQLITLAAVLLFVTCSGCGGDTHESLAADTMSTMKEITTILHGVTDEASAKNAKSQIKSLMDKLKDINEKESKLKAPTEAELKELDTKYGKEMEDVARKFQAEIMRVAFMPKVGEVFQDIDTNMKMH